MQFLLRGVGFLLTGMLVACGGDGGEPAPLPFQQPGGVYSGTFTFTDPERVEQVTGVVFEYGDGFFFSDEVVFRTGISNNAYDISAPLDAYAVYGTTWDGTKTLRIGSITGTLDDRDRMYGEFSLTDEGEGEFDLDYQQTIHLDSVTSADIIGTYSMSDPDTGYTLSVTFETNNRINGQDSNSCTIAGRYTMPDSQYNAILLSNMSITCSDYTLADGEGAAYYLENGNDPEELVFGVRYLIENGGPASESVVGVTGRYTKN